MKRFIVACPPKLSRLRVVGWDSCHETLQLLQNCETLLELRVGFLDPYFGRSESVTLPHLEVFRCSSYMIEDRVSVLCSMMPKLQTLIVVKPLRESHIEFVVQSRILNLILDKLIHLRQFVTMAECEGLLRPHPLPAITACHAPGAGMCVLEELYITTSSYFNGQPHHFSIDPIFARCPRLHRVGVSTPPVASLHDGDGVAFFRTCTNARLERLVVVQSSLTDKQIELVRGYEELMLLDCGNLCDRSFAALARNNPLLRVLQIQKAGLRSIHLSRVTHRALLTFLEQCPLLHSVEFVFQEDHAQKAHVHNQSMFMLMLRKLYPHVSHFACNVV